MSAAAAAALRAGSRAVAVAVIIGLAACASRLPPPAGQESFVAVPAEAWPAFSDDLDRASLEAALAGSLAYLEGLEPELRYRFGRRPWYSEFATAMAWMVDFTPPAHVSPRLADWSTIERTAGSGRPVVLNEAPAPAAVPAAPAFLVSPSMRSLSRPVISSAMPTELR